MAANMISPEQIEELRQFSSCVLASAIETFQVRLRNTDFTSRIRCMFPELPPVVGYAVTARIRTADPPMEGKSYYMRNEWLDEVSRIPAPRIFVVQDLDDPAGLGAFVGEVHAAILQALGCVGVVTNGAVRDLKRVRPMGFQMFAGGVSVSHAYAHVFDFGGAVKVDSLEARPGDLLHGDLHGVQTVPLEIADRLAPVARQILRNRQDLVRLCQSQDFSLEKLRAAICDAEACFEGRQNKE